MVNLARILTLLHKYDDAIALMTRCLSIRERVFGKTDPLSVATASNIDTLREMKRRYQEQCAIM